MSNNKYNQMNDNKSFFKCTSGAVAVSFAIMLPTLFICMLVSINYAETMRNRARLSEATNEASLAIIALDNKNVGNEAIEQNRKMALNYINYFTDQKISDNLAKESGATINIEYSERSGVYSVVYAQKSNSLTSSDKNNKKDDVLNLSIPIEGNTESYGNTKKFQRFDAYDIAFVADFSGSVTCKYQSVDNPNCNSYSEAIDAGQQRLEYMNNAIIGIIKRFNGDSTKFALVPYDIGVPVKQNTANPADGESYGCSVMYKMKPPYGKDKIDYNFWANKNIAYGKWSSLKTNGAITIDKDNEGKDDYSSYDYFNKFKNTVYYYLDYFNYRYYSQIIGPAKGLYSDGALVSGGLCRSRSPSEQINMGNAKFACGENNPDYPLSSRNKNIVKEQYGKVVQLYNYMFSGNFNDVHYSFANTKTVDVDGTINELFEGMDGKTITFNRPISPASSDFSPFLGMCQSPLYNNGIMSERVINMNSNVQRYQEASRHIGTFKLSPYLVPFSSDKDHNRKLLRYMEHGNWQPGGGTDTMTALLRTVPIMASSTADNKLIIIITDGKDDAGADILRDQFLDKGICQAITSGLTSSDNRDKGLIARVAKTAAIHYIMLNPEANNLSTDAQYEAIYGKWFTKCMNGNVQYLHEAQDYQTLLDTMTKIIQTETGNFVIKDESRTLD
ncbi:TadE/TadG family type IV pilus assembly protein [Gilliamella sp. ESL0250]|uniref:TadE/TadG family type IV pilus assembly protein n=1 Tax=Gilliamella sp. ESL0250 TaxID=2705036 RepID=UPI00157FD64F|nr:TadE/TadG family type IV pilus assembly protein [Gilliamella sp. ESL0250]NUF48521.1 hypothetical protein [Gilliamella sp. ESL0250]